MRELAGLALLLALGNPIAHAQSKPQSLTSPQTPAEIQLWTSAELQTRTRALKLNERGQGVDRLENWANHSLQQERLEGSTLAEAHQTLADVFVITSGEVTLIAGGVIEEPNASSPTETRGKSITGGTTRKLAVGDVVHIPAKTPHQLIVEAGKQSTFLILKVETK